MTAYLYTWNPARWNWVDLPNAICRINEGQPYDIPWSCGNTKRMAVGDRFFLMQLGVEPKGIIGCGYIASEFKEEKHWDSEKDAAGKTMLATDLQFKALSNEPIFPLPYLQAHYPSYSWTPQRGGLSLPDDVAEELWDNILSNESFTFQQESVDEIRHYMEGKPKTITVHTYDRNAAARQKCLETHGYTCSVCDFRFEEVYGDWGRDYIEVHHLNPVSSIGYEYEIDPKTGLRPVCANCHRMLHRKKTALSIHDLKKFIKDGRVVG